MKPLDSKVILITGATSGIGKATAIALAKMGATVVFCARDIKRGRAAKREIILASRNANVDVFYCDLASFASIREFCEKFGRKYRNLHVLINNAGIWNYMGSQKTSIDGIEETFAVNYLAPFLLTNLLLGILKKSAPSRIINVASGLHTGTINFGDIELRESFSGRKAYAQSKLALILFTRLIAKRLEGTGVTVNAVHPGFVATNLSRNAGAVSRAFVRLVAKSPKKGAETPVYLASSKDVENITGEYFADKKIQKSSPQSYNMAMAEKLWDLSIRYTRLNSRD